MGMIKKMTVVGLVAGALALGVYSTQIKSCVEEKFPQTTVLENKLEQVFTPDVCELSDKFVDLEETTTNTYLLAEKKNSFQGYDSCVEKTIGSLDQIKENVLGYASDELKEKSYLQAVSQVQSSLDANPKIANKLIYSGIEAIANNKDADFDSDTFVAMFNIVSEKAETNPEILDHLGPNAEKYLSKGFIENFYEGIKKLNPFGDEE